MLVNSPRVSFFNRFETIDLHEDSNTTAVVNCLIALRVATSS
jgi:hypothetical protein